VKVLPEQWQAPLNLSAEHAAQLEIVPFMSQQLEGVSQISVQALVRLCRLPENIKAAYLRLEDWLLLQASLFDLLSSRREGMLFLHGKDLQSEISSFPLPDYAGGVWLDASEAIEAYFTCRESAELLQQQRQRLHAVMHAAREKGKRKRYALGEDLDHAQGSEHLRIWGELLKMAPEPGRRLSAIELVNYYDENLAPLLIPLDQRMTVAENAQSFFKRYSKFRIGERYINDQLQNLDRDLDYIAGVLVAIEQAQSVEDLKEIAIEMVEQGYLPPEVSPRMRGKAKAKEAPLPPLALKIEGIDVLVGRNNRQNEELTWRIARSDDLWLHTKDIPGSHLLIRSSDPSNSVLEKAARLAAWYSQARESGLVPVDITLRRHVRKPRGARPGFVLYGNQRTVYIKPAAPEELTDVAPG